MADDRAEFLQILKLGYAEGDFVLASGQRSSFYLDARIATHHPRGALLAGRLVFARVRPLRPHAIGGLTIGADPIATAASIASAETDTPIGAFVVRKEAKEHGRGRLIEGTPLEPGMRVVVVDDVGTTGGSLVKAVEAVRSAGAEVVLALVLVDRGQGARERLESMGVPYDALYRIEELRGEAASRSAAPGGDGQGGERQSP